MLERAGRQRKAQVWDEAARMLSRPARLKVEVNVGRISRMAGRSAAFFVPGKVLGSGLLDRKVVVGAFAFSETARRKIGENGGSAMSVEQFLKKYPKGKGVRLVE